MKAFFFLSLFSVFGVAQLPNKHSTGNVLPPFEITTIDSVFLTNDSLKGKTWLIEFWASWCLPCRKTNQSLNESLAMFRSKDSTFDQRFGILGISLDKSSTVHKKAIKNDESNWTHHAIDSLIWKGEVAKQFHLMYMPYNYLVDSSGVIRAQGLHGMALQSKIGKLLNIN